MKERPILYSTPMINAKLEGRKTQTRRIIKTPRGACGFYVVKNKHTGEVTSVLAHDENERTERPDGREWVIKCPYGAVGDVLYAREMIYQEGELGLKYVADNEPINNDIIPEDHRPYRNYAHCNIPSIHMPKYLARIWDRITDIRVERLQDISVEDCIAEGVRFDEDSGYFFVGDDIMSGDAQECYRLLWININGQESYDSNPFVWVLKTETLSTTGKPEL